MKKTVLNSLHRDLGARLVEFGGYEMPVQYRSIVEEHRIVRTGAGLFDLCHMGRFEVRGERAVEAVDRVATNHVAKMKPGQIRYSLILNDLGGVRDDILIYRMPDRVFLVVNAGNRDKLMGWFAERLVMPGASLHDVSEDMAMIALQGPDSSALLAPHVTTTWVPSLADLGYYAISDAKIEIEGNRYTGWISRTGYTGEDGFELYVKSDGATALWHDLQASGGDRIHACGLGARDTLRLEAGMPLYGHELDEATSPLEAGLGFAIKLKKPNGFIGRDALMQQKADGVPRGLRAFSVASKRVAREGMPVFQAEREVGRVTSGGPSPTLGKNIALCYIASDVAADAELTVQVRKNREPLVSHPMPFYKRGRVDVE